MEDAGAAVDKVATTVRRKDITYKTPTAAAKGRYIIISSAQPQLGCGHGR